ncbi:circularly permuted type 2 ATP-grasp protein [Parahaliea aestuarii]|uniref:Circularly permuted type 2 ATP-grasp protein n=1 Tax=Parahaliea aestuarii TaxID=1852021 RepID=A0A5C8ZN26_9GAMM|nr:circularly permuted type 2 ATP-grasp protein [Parahaliea aestuarii]TXS89162.1 circularly permuted type 2 ATP-grasp protein [Parahaliea aestuarii]
MLKPSDSASVAASGTAFSEAYAPDGDLRQHWEYLLGSLSGFSAEERSDRLQMVERLLQDDGASYNDYSSGGAREWSLDPLPLLLDSREWQRIESGVRERAELLNLVLRDIYGPRSLIKLGIIPAELVFGHPGFLRACDGIALPGEQHIIQYAVDMLRGPDGRMRVIADRTQVPSGAGYALENRRVMARVFPSLFRDSHVHRLSHYFNSLRTRLNTLAPNGGLPRVVMLTPGAYNETYFEHLFLANYLGYSLVQGSDLTVRDGYVWLKTLGGLSRIDVILRRVDDDYCDPVELRPDSQLGVPGLLEVVRAGRVAVANPLGCGVLENTALLKYLPAAARHLLGREPALEAAPTYWCGDPEDRALVLDRFEDMVIKSIHSGSDGRTVHAGSLARAGRETLRQRILQRPGSFSAQPFLQPSLTPVWDGEWDGPGAGSAAGRPAILRTFAVAGESSYIVMSGGLTRVARADGNFEISNRAGSPSKDTWVLASEPEKLEPAASQAIAREPGASAELPSRVVENLFWLGRYTERAESALRLLRIVFASLDGANPPSADSRSLLLRAVTQLTCTYPGFMVESGVQKDPQPELLAVVLESQRPGSVAHSLAAMLSTVGQVKDFMSTDTQRILNDVSGRMQQLPRRLQHGVGPAQQEELNALVTALLALAGLVQESMVRGQGWHFLQAGRRIERSLQILSLLRSLWVRKTAGEDQDLMLETALLSLDSLSTYRHRYQRQLDVASGLDHLLLNAANPRSVLFQLEELKGHLEQIPVSAGNGRLPRPQRLLLEAGTQLQLADLEALASGGGDVLRSGLDQLLARSHHLLGGIATAISDHCFDHTGGPRPLGPGPDRREVEP